MPPVLSIRGLTKRFDPAAPPVVDAVDLDVAEGEIVALLGPSGCGKTTTLRLVAGFERADAGTITVAGRLFSEGPRRLVPPERRGLGIVFQDYALFPHLTVLENVRFGLQALPRAERTERAREALRLVGLAGYEDRHPHTLSGGQQQRVAIARSLAPAPRLLLLDEPFSNLDALLRQTTREEIRAVLKRAGMTAVLVTHDQEEALSFADRVAVMRQGRIEQVGTPEQVYYEPRTLFVAQFLGRTNLLLAEAHGTEARTPLGRVALSRPAHGHVLVALRPEHLTLDVPEPGLPAGEVVAREFKGHDITFRVRLEGAEYLVHTHNRMAFRPGDAVRVRPLEAAVVLEGQGAVPAPAG
ncbi:MAG: iron(III) ABC transporter ATP-binding protein [Rhodothermaceae bacterium]|nr:MAG: iron(III) ABC transporter ATP-binding protein [Rhodothermaceae bacterium]